MLVIEEEWLSWKQHPVTEEYFKMLVKERERVKENLVMGAYEDVGKAQGVAQALLDLKEMKYADFREASYGE